ncbi:uncharacterized protein KZ484_019538 isoform 2-T2 [Pholidichthys leucotaenia]
MASADQDHSESESDFEYDSDEDSTDSQTPVKEPCKYYNKGFCKDGHACAYLHVCKYALRGNCRYGSSCKLNHNVGGKTTPKAVDPPSSAPKLTDGRYYQWQLDDGSGWKDIENDHVIEAQYSLPHTKSIKIYNTSYGAVCMDFNRMKVYGKKLRVRRLDDGSTVWIWYCTLGRKWTKYESKDAKGNSAVSSSDIETNFQSDPTGSFTFTMSSDTYTILFNEMRQVGPQRKRKVTRRPLYRKAQSGVIPAQPTPELQNLSLNSKPVWQFEGDNGKWFIFKNRSGTPTNCSVNSEDIERNYQQNSNGSMQFTVNGTSYKLDFGAMIQTNLTNRKKRKVRRVLQ